jgi:heme exporter protein D
MENSQNSFSVPRWFLEMGCFGFGVYMWVGVGLFSLPRAKNIKKL